MKLKYSIILIPIIIYIFVITTNSSLSYELKSLEQELEVIKEENQELQVKVAELRTADNILALAQAQGMVSNDKLGILEIKRGIAIR